MEIGRPSGPRKSVNLLVKLSEEGVDDFVEEKFATDISSGGMFVWSRTPRAVGTGFQVRVEIAGGARVLQAAALVRWTRKPDDPNGPPGMGLEFYNVDPASAALIDRMMAPEDPVDLASQLTNELASELDELEAGAGFTDDFAAAPPVAEEGAAFTDDFAPVSPMAGPDDFTDDFEELETAPAGVMVPAHLRPSDPGELLTEPIGVRLPPPVAAPPPPRASAPPGVAQPGAMPPAPRPLEESVPDTAPRGLPVIAMTPAEAATALSDTKPRGLAAMTPEAAAAALAPVVPDTAPRGLPAMTPEAAAAVLSDTAPRGLAALTPEAAAAVLSDTAPKGLAALTPEAAEAALASTAQRPAFVPGAAAPASDTAQRPAFVPGVAAPASDTAQRPAFVPGVSASPTSDTATRVVPSGVTVSPASDTAPRGHPAFVPSGLAIPPSVPVKPTDSGVRARVRRDLPAAAKLRPDLPEAVGTADTGEHPKIGSKVRPAVPLGEGVRDTSPSTPAIPRARSEDPATGEQPAIAEPLGAALPPRALSEGPADPTPTREQPAMPGALGAKEPPAVEQPAIAPVTRGSADPGASGPRALAEGPADPTPTGEQPAMSAALGARRTQTGEQPAIAEPLGAKEGSADPVAADPTPTGEQPATSGALGRKRPLGGAFPSPVTQGLPPLTGGLAIPPTVPVRPSAPRSSGRFIGAPKAAELRTEVTGLPSLPSMPSGAEARISLRPSEPSALVTEARPLPSAEVSPDMLEALRAQRTPAAAPDTGKEPAFTPDAGEVIDLVDEDLSEMPAADRTVRTTIPVAPPAPVISPKPSTIALSGETTETPADDRTGQFDISDFSETPAEDRTGRYELPVEPVPAPRATGPSQPQRGTDPSLPAMSLDPVPAAPTPGVRPAARQTGSIPAVQAPAARSTGPSLPAMPAARQTGSIPAVQVPAARSTGPSLPAMPAARQTGSIPAVQVPAARSTGPSLPAMPAARQTGSIPAVQAPAARSTGPSLPAQRGTDPSLAAMPAGTLGLAPDPTQTTRAPPRTAGLERLRSTDRSLPQVPPTPPRAPAPPPAPNPFAPSDPSPLAGGKTQRATGLKPAVTPRDLPAVKKKEPVNISVKELVRTTPKPADDEKTNVFIDAALTQPVQVPLIGPPGTAPPPRRTTRDLSVIVPRGVLKAVPVRRSKKVDDLVFLGPPPEFVKDSPLVGIDLGTTNSVCAVLAGGRPVVLKTASGSSVVPSLVAITKAQKLAVGYAAHAEMMLNPANCIAGSKRLVGRDFDSPAVEAARERFAYDVVAGPDGKAAVVLGGKTVSMEEIQAIVLTECRLMAEKFLSKRVSRAVVTCPAYFTEAQRQSIKVAGALAGLRIERILIEPTAAALAYGLNQDLSRKVLVYDVGGGTFDATLLRIEKNVFEVLATGGDVFLGGLDFDHQLIDSLVKRFEAEHNVLFNADPGALARIADQAEKAKIALSEKESVEVRLPMLQLGDRGKAMGLSTTLTRAELEEFCAPLIERTLEIVQGLLKDGGLKASQVDEVVLVGGMSRMPMVRERLRALFKKQPHASVNAEEAIAVGAALFTGVVDKVSNVVLIDVAPMTIGFGLPGGGYKRLINRNTPLPASASFGMATTEDNADVMEISVFQGEDADVAVNDYVGTIRIDGLPRAPKGVVKLAINLKLDADCVLHVEARELHTRRRFESTLATRYTTAEVQSRLGIKPQEARAALLRRTAEIKKKGGGLWGFLGKLVGRKK